MGHTVRQREIKEEQEAKEAQLAEKAANITAATARLEAAQAALEAKIADFEIRMARASDHPTNKGEVHTDLLPRGRTIPMGELGENLPIEAVTSGDMLRMEDKIKLEAFMHELVQIRVSEDGNENSTIMAIPTVNGSNQPIIRGVPTWIKRKYVESLARARISNFNQKLADPNKRDSYEMVERPAATYTFSVLSDTPRGHAWLQQIMDQPQT